jgi:hydrogenase nickel incorporation protein HypB
MCATCGCSDHPTSGAHDDGHRHHHEHAHAHPHPHDHAHDHHDHRADRPATIDLHRAVLQKNDRIAERNRGWLGARGVLAVNFLSSPGAGKTTLLERTIRDLRPGTTFAVIEGDQATSRDADRIRRAGARAVQINTGIGCHLDADMVARALPELDPPRGTVVAIENVGNLVCPALFDLGEDAKVVVASVTEGDDKPLKYPHMFRACSLVLLNKVDLLDHVPFDPEAFERDFRQVNASAEIHRVSAARGDGLDDWYAWLGRRLAARLTAPREGATP